jgi:hypothetical protein
LRKKNVVISPSPVIRNDMRLRAGSNLETAQATKNCTGYFLKIAVI